MDSAIACRAERNGQSQFFFPTYEGQTWDILAAKGSASPQGVINTNLIAP